MSDSEQGPWQIAGDIGTPTDSALMAEFENGIRVIEAVRELFLDVWPRKNPTMVKELGPIVLPAVRNACIRIWSGAALRALRKQVSKRDLAHLLLGMDSLGESTLTGELWWTAHPFTSGSQCLLMIPIHRGLQEEAVKGADEGCMIIPLYGVREGMTARVATPWPSIWWKADTAIGDLDLRSSTLARYAPPDLDTLGYTVPPLTREMVFDFALWVAMGMVGIQQKHLSVSRFQVDDATFTRAWVVGQPGELASVFPQ